MVVVGVTVVLVHPLHKVLLFKIAQELELYVPVTVAESTTEGPKQILWSAPAFSVRGAASCAYVYVAVVVQPDGSVHVSVYVVAAV